MHEEIDILRIKLDAAQEKLHSLTQESMDLMVKLERLDADLKPLRQKILYSNDNLTQRVKDRMTQEMENKKIEIAELSSKRCSVRYQQWEVQRTIENLQSQIKAASRRQESSYKILDEYARMTKSHIYVYTDENGKEIIPKVVQDGKTFRIPAMAIPPEIEPVEFKDMYAYPPGALAFLLDATKESQEE